MAARARRKRRMNGYETKALAGRAVEFMGETNGVVLTVNKDGRVAAA